MVSPKVREGDKMKQLFYSEVLNQYFDSEKECQDAELQYTLDKQEKEKAAAEAEIKRKEELALTSKEKKELSDAIETAKQKVTEAENEYELAYDTYKKKVAEAKEAYEKTITEAKETILTPATDSVKNAQKAQYEAVKAFNDKFGTYTVKYTGDQAYKEMMKTVNTFNKIFNNFWF